MSLKTNLDQLSHDICNLLTFIFPTDINTRANFPFQELIRKLWRYAYKIIQFNFVKNKS